MVEVAVVVVVAVVAADAADDAAAAAADVSVSPVAIVISLWVHHRYCKRSPSALQE